MSAKQSPASGTVPLSVSCPGGMARQFRVQVKGSECPPHWNLVGSFRDESAAGQCAQQLSKSGQQTRVIACRSLPTAA